MMKPERIALDSLIERPGGEFRMKGIAERIRQGSLFVYPTETIYGIGGSCTFPGSKDKIYKAKKRAPDNPLILLAADAVHFEILGIRFPPSALKLADAFWPGKLTLVVPSELEPGGVAVRTSDHPFITALYRELDIPVYSTSANHSGEPYVNDPERIYAIFRNDIDFMIDAGPLPPSAPSTVVKVTSEDTVSVIREGVLKREDLEKALGCKV